MTQGLDGLANVWLHNSLLRHGNQGPRLRIGTGFSGSNIVEHACICMQDADGNWGRRRTRRTSMRRRGRRIRRTRMRQKANIS
eukprot:7774929-Pyramimonas_sp.AAC.1